MLSNTPANQFSELSGWALKDYGPHFMAACALILGLVWYLRITPAPSTPAPFPEVWLLDLQFKYDKCQGSIKSCMYKPPWFRIDRVSQKSQRHAKLLVSRPSQARNGHSPQQP